MSDLRSMEIQTDSKHLTTSPANIGGLVAANMKRWVTFVALDAIDNDEAKTVRLYMASVAVSNPTMASIIATGNRKMMLDLRATGIAQATNQTPNGPPLMIPDQPNADKPLFSIAGGSYLGVYASVTSANVFVQYFDE